jgi:hypothetical protein
MQRYYDELKRYTREDGFEVIVDKSYEDSIHPRDCFDTPDVKEICEKIDNGIYDWFFLRVRVLLDGYTMGDACVGGCCYEDAKEVLTDGTADDMINEAVEEALRNVGSLKRKLDAFVV